MNALLVGTAVGAYGVSAMRWLPHLPLEWAALAVAAAAYVDSRSGPARFSEALRTVVLAALLVGAAAAAEVYLTPQ